MPWVSSSNPTYLRVYARQRPGGVAWDAVPLTVRGLNKAAGNPPFKYAPILTKVFILYIGSRSVEELETTIQRKCAPARTGKNCLAT